MTPEQRRGRLYVLLSVLTLVTFDVALKVMLYLTGHLRPGQIVGTILTIVLCYFLWRGSRVAHIILIACAALSILFGLLVSTLLSYMRITFMSVATVMVIAWCAPATRSFLSLQRQRDA